MRFRRFLILICCIAVTFSSIPAQSNSSIDAETLLPGSSGERITSAYPTDLPARGGDVDLGLALSGGGFRSAAFSIGVLKALYDKGVMDDIDVISSVSGGGYASYWTFTKFHGAPGSKFGSAAFGEDSFSTNVCNLARKSEFLPLRRMFGGLFSSDDNAFRKYREAIEFTFGADDTQTRDEKRHVGETPLLPFTAFNDQIDKGDAPYFILNTTIAKDDIKALSDLNVDRSFEITPKYRGNKTLGFSEWPNNTPSVKTWCGGVALSAAAIRFKLARKMQNYSSKVTNKSEIKMYDGGFSENLGALPLIRRHLRKIIIVDAENDAAYRFQSYRALKEYVKATEIGELSVKAIDTFLDGSDRPSKKYTKDAVAEGVMTYKDGSEPSTIYYIKMSRPSTIIPKDGSKTWPDGRPLPEAKRSKTRPSTCPATGVDPVTTESLTNGMVTYSRYLNETWSWRYFFKVMPYVNYNFPQLATVDQTYYRDQLEAFIGLGYLEGSEISKHKALN